MELKHSDNLKILIFIPTYNEAQNLKNLYEEIKKLDLITDFLVVDDNSEDGTKDVIKSLSNEDPQFFSIIRSGKLGIGSAHKAGIRWAKSQQYDYLITMDCDFTHPPEYIPDLLNKTDSADVIIGSRYLKSGSLEGWSLFRKILTYMGHFMTIQLLKMPYDASSAFRCYNLKLPLNLLCDKVVSDSYSFFFESLFILQINRVKIKEISIHLPARTAGKSKMTLNDAYKSIKYLLELYVKKIFANNKLKL
ncbi:MAG: polyprenol monophosphomannose synthase [Saprospiraceae bacterium]